MLRNVGVGCKKVLDLYPDISTEQGEGLVDKMNTLIMHYLHVQEPEKLSNEMWSKRWKQVRWLLWFENKRTDLKPGEKMSI